MILRVQKALHGARCVAALRAKLGALEQRVANASADLQLDEVEMIYRDEDETLGRTAFFFSRAHAASRRSARDAAARFVALT